MRLGGAYPTFQALVADDCAAHASLLLPLPDRRCTYKFARAAYYSECQLLALSWNRSDHTFRLYFDARGEPDLPDPQQSSIGIVVRRPRPDRAELRADMQATTARCVCVSVCASLRVCAGCMCVGESEIARAHVVRAPRRRPLTLPCAQGARDDSRAGGSERPGLRCSGGGCRAGAGARASANGAPARAAERRV